MSEKQLAKIHLLLSKIYGSKAEEAFKRISEALRRFGDPRSTRRHRMSSRDIVLITYGDTLQSGKDKSLRTLHRFMRRYLKDCVSAVHLLPFYPYSSDDGFSVIDFQRVDAALGDWEDVARLGGDFELMFDYVLNHISAQSPWFADYLAERQPFADLAIEVAPDADLSKVVRPRSLPLLTPFTRLSGTRVHVWTTFSGDQIDLNYKSIDVLVRMIEVLLFYVAGGARMLRLDAVAYLWKEEGTGCIHLPQTHQMVRLLRAILDHAAPDVVLVTETNVPHAENIRYFGNGFDEAQMVYNFTLPPLLLHTFLTGDGKALSQWAQDIGAPGDQTAFFNFTASHDGIGVRPLEDILDARQITSLVRAAHQAGGQVSYKQNTDGSQSPYELNVTYVDALRCGQAAGREQSAARFLASQAIALAFPGVPGIYIHSLLGSRNWYAGVVQSGRARSINREKLMLEDIQSELEDETSWRARIFFPYRRMLRIRRKQAAFEPHAAHAVLNLGRGVFAIRRSGGGQTIFALTNIRNQSAAISSLAPYGASGPMRDLLSDTRVSNHNLILSPYQSVWLTPL